MTIQEANDILQHPKDHWSHEKDEALEYAKDAINVLCVHGENGKIIKSIDYYVNLNRQLRRNK